MLRGSRFSLAWMVLLAVLPISLIASGRLATLIPVQGAFRDLLWFLPYFLFLVTSFLGLRAHQLPILFSSLLLALAYHLGWRLRFPLSEPQALLLQASAIAVPCSLFLISLPKSGKLLGRSGLLFLALTVLPWISLGGLAYLIQPPWRDFLLWHGAPPFDWVRIPILGAVFLVPVMGVMFLRKDRYLGEFQLAVAVSLVAWLFLLNRALSPGQGSLLLLASAAVHSSIGMIVLYSVYRLYWRKVYIDELTGLPNRRALDEKLADLGGNYAVAMADIDHFKKFNDLFGHEEGDNVLRFVGAYLDEATESRVFRYGGEEFCVVCENMSDLLVEDLLERARAGLAARPFFIRSPVAVREHSSPKDRVAFKATPAQRVQVTMSFGVERAGAAAQSAHDVIKAADQHLYKAKKAGRNCVVLGWKVAPKAVDKIEA